MAWAARLPSVLVFLFGPPLDGPPSRLVPRLYEGLDADHRPVSVDARFTAPAIVTLPHGAPTWSVDDPGRARVEDGEVRVLTPGNTTAHARWRGVEAGLPLGPDAPFEVRFRITVPANTPDDATVEVRGDLPQLGAWEGAGLTLERNGPRLWTGTLALPRGTVFEFKVTRGGWETVEKDPDGGEVPNRRAVADGDPLVALQVARWADLP